MAFNFNFRTVNDTKDLKQLINFLAKQDLEYPNYQDWVQKTEYEIYVDYKKSILAFSNGYLVGDLIYQQHKELYSILELKNLRIHKDFRGRSFAPFMLKQVEHENKGKFDAIICDVRENREKEINFLLVSGYKPIFTKSIYNQNIEDIIFIKIFDTLNKNKIITKAKNLFL